MGAQGLPLGGGHGSQRSRRGGREEHKNTRNSSAGESPALVIVVKKGLKIATSDLRGQGRGGGGVITNTAL